MKKNRVTIIKRYGNVDFGIFDGVEDDNVIIKPVHGDVFVVKGMVEEDPEEIMTLGVEKGKDYAVVALYKPLDVIKEELAEVSG